MDEMACFSVLKNDTSDLCIDFYETDEKGVIIAMKSFVVNNINQNAIENWAFVKEEDENRPNFEKC